MIDYLNAKEAAAGQRSSSSNAQGTSRATTSHVIETNPLPPSYNDQIELQPDDEWSQLVSDLRVQRQQLLNARRRGDQAAVIIAERKVSESMAKLSTLAGASQEPRTIIVQGGRQLETERKAQSGPTLRPFMRLFRGSPSDSAVTTLFRGCLVVVLSPLIIIGFMFHGIGLLIIGIGKGLVLFGDIVSLWQIRWTELWRRFMDAHIIHSLYLGPWIQLSLGQVQRSSSHCIYIYILITFLIARSYRNYDMID